MGTTVTPPRTTVFRFVALRNPDRISEKAASLLFVTPSALPSGAAAFYPTALTIANNTSVPDPADKRDLLHAAAASFMGTANWLGSVSGVKGLSPNAFEFENWLRVNQKTTTRTALLAQANTMLGVSGTVPFLSASSLKNLWDNLFVAVVESFSIEYIRAIKSFLRVNHVLEILLGDSTLTASADIRRLVQAEVLFPEFPFENFQDVSTYTPTTPNRDKLEAKLQDRGTKIASYTTAEGFIKALKKFWANQRKHLSTLTPGSEAEIAYNLEIGFVTEDNSTSLTDLSELLTLLDLSLPFSIQEAITILESIAAKEIGAALGNAKAVKTVVAHRAGLWKLDDEYLPPSNGTEEKGPYTPPPSLYSGFFHNGRDCNPMPFLIADLRVVTQELCCYKPGEIAHIENVMKMEIRERATKRTVSTEETIYTSTERVKEEERDVQSTERNELQQHVSNILSEDSSLNVGANLSTSWGQVTLSTNFDYSQNNSNYSSAESSRDFAKETTERAVSRIMERVLEERTTRITKSFEDSNLHRFENIAAGAEHIVGIYRWLDKLLKNTVENLGKRMMIEVYLPEPAAFHFYALALRERETQQQAINAAATLQAPVNPSDGFTYLDEDDLLQLLTLRAFSDLTTTNYLAWANLYNAEVESPPDNIIYVSQACVQNQATNDHAFDCSVEIPEGYFPFQVGFTFAQDRQPNDEAHVVFGTSSPIPIANNNTDVIYRGMVNNLFPFPDLFFNNHHNVKSKLPVVVYGNTYYFTLNYVATCHLTDEALNAWKQKTYRAIMSAYNRLKTAYETALAAAQQTLQTGGTGGLGLQNSGRNPAYNRETERTELKRAAIYYLNGGSMPPNHWIDPFPADTGDLIPEFSYCANVLNTPYVRFLESAFDWKNMTYEFFPYFYARKSQWVNLYLTEDEDPLFASFLKAGYAKVLLPVQPGHEMDVLQFMSQGWNPKMPSNILANHPLVLDLLGHLKDPAPDEDYTTEPWTTKVPTSLICLQNDSSPLEGEGLPCPCEEEG